MRKEKINRVKVEDQIKRRQKEITKRKDKKEYKPDKERLKRIKPKSK